MRLKRLLAGVLCAAMVFTGSMSTIYADESNPDYLETLSESEVDIEGDSTSDEADVVIEDIAADIEEAEPLLEDASDDEAEISDDKSDTDSLKVEEGDSLGVADSEDLSGKDSELTDLNRIVSIEVRPECHIGQDYEACGGWGSKSELEQADKEARRVVNELIKPGMCDLEKIFVLAKYLNENVEYGMGNSNNKGQTAYEALILKKSVCAGNAAAYNMLTYYAGINSNYLASSQLNHAFCEVELNGKWYYVDAQNSIAFDTFLMAADSDKAYVATDIGTENFYDIKPYNYSDKVEKCDDKTFEKIPFCKEVELRREGNTIWYTFKLDWPTFSKNLADKGIDVAAYKSTETKKTFKGVNVKKLSIKFSKTVFDYDMAHSEMGILPNKLSIKYKGVDLYSAESFNDKFDLTFENNRQCGTATLTLSAKEDSGYSGSITKKYKINGTAVSKAKPTNFIKAIPYDGTRIEQNFGVSDNYVHMDVKLAGETKRLNYYGNDSELSDYFVEYTFKKDTNVGSVVVLITGNVNRGYTGTKKLSYKIVPVKLDLQDSGFSVDPIADKVYTGDKITPQVAISYTFADGRVYQLIEGTDYTLSYRNNKKPGQASDKKAPAVVIKGKKNFKGSIIRNFNILES